MTPDNTFTLDTSGVVYINVPGMMTERPRVWSDLSPFCQGYVEAALRAWNSTLFGPDGEGYSDADFFGFRHLAPATLAAMMKDCDLALGLGAANTAEAGAQLWAIRQANGCDPFPPLTLSLDEAGKVVIA